MSTHALLSAPAEENRTLSDAAAGRASRVGWAMFGVGLLAALIACLWQVERFWASYLVAFTYLLSISLGALFFVVIQHLVRAGWSVTVRRVSEAIAANFLLLAVLAIPIGVGTYYGKLLPMASGVDAAEADETHPPAGAHDEQAAGDHATAAPVAPVDLGDWERGPVLPEAAHAPLGAYKATWLSFPWVMARLVIYFALWILTARFYMRTSVAQDATGDPALTARMQRWSAPAVLVFGLTTTLAGFDLLMGLAPYWYSTMFGVYFFAGGFLVFCAALIVALYLLQRSGHLTVSVTTEHYHDVGKFMLAFIVFWAYIAYAQYMLIWYANIPEETVWFYLRQTGDWVWVSTFLILGHFALPFFLLLSRFPKRRPHLLMLGAAYVLLVHFADTFWIIVPQKSPLGTFPPPVMDLALLLSLTGLYVVSTVRNLRGVDLIPVRDPRLIEALNHQNY